MTRVMVRNPVSGDGGATDRAAAIARDRGIEVRDSSEPGEAVSIAHAAATEADQLLACGGDGTVNEVVSGIHEADALADVELAAVPAGTGNGFAGKIGVTSVEEAFEVADQGRRRQLDLGMADGHPFVESCMGGLVAAASEDTSDELKARTGSLAYVLQTLADSLEYEGRLIEVSAGDSDDPLWAGQAEVVLVGNARRFAGEGEQANLEDGLFEVVVVERAPAIDYLADDALGFLFDRTADHLSRFAVTGLTLTAVDDAMEFSLDGEIVERRDMDLRVHETALPVRVGGGYDPSPPPWSGE